MQGFAHIPNNSPLESYITLIWELNGSNKQKEVILPKGIIEIIFNLSDPMSAILPGFNGERKAPDCFIQGVHTGVTHVNYHDHQHLFGVRLKPHAVRSLLGIQPFEISNQAIDLTLINPHFREVWCRLVEAGSFQERIKIVECHFVPVKIRYCRRTEMLSNLFFGESLPFLKARHQNRNMVSGDYFESVNAMANDICFSPRHLNRKTRELFGMNAEELIRYKKFVSAIELMHKTDFSLSEIAHLCGFYDQAHFIRVFKNYSSMTPKTYQKNKGILPFHLFA